MQLTIQRRLLVAVGAISLCIAPTVLAQKERMPILRGNPYRDIGGSCVYGRQGELLYAPKGARCTPTQEEKRQDAETVPSGRPESLSPTIRAQILTLLEGHSHVAGELAELRRAVAEGRKADALQASDHIIKELAEHLAREEQLFGELLAQ